MQTAQTKQVKPRFNGIPPGLVLSSTNSVFCRTDTGHHEADKIMRYCSQNKPSSTNEPISDIPTNSDETVTDQVIEVDSGQSSAVVPVVTDPR